MSNQRILPPDNGRKVQRNPNRLTTVRVWWGVRRSQLLEVNQPATQWKRNAGCGHLRSTFSPRCLLCSLEVYEPIKRTGAQRTNRQRGWGGDGESPELVQAQRQHTSGTANPVPLFTNTTTYMCHITGT